VQRGCAPHLRSRSEGLPKDAYHCSTVRVLPGRKLAHCSLLSAAVTTLMTLGVDGTSFGQANLAFEVAAIKPNRSDTPPTSRFPLGSGDAFVPGGVFVAINQPLITYLRFAFRSATLEGLPSWVSVERFDIDARAAGSPSKDEMRRMMETLLKERFGLAIHTERRAGTGLALRMVKKGALGPKLRRADPKSCNESSASSALIPCGRIGPSPASESGRLRISGRSISLGRLAAMLTNSATGIDRPVFDETALSGLFDLDIEWTADADNLSDLTKIEAVDLTFSQALQDQLGLKLIATTGTVEVLRVDRVDRPTAD